MPKFKPGQSGNPKGRPKGAMDRRNRLRALLEPHADALVAKVVELARDVDTTALKLCLERLVPPMKPQDDPVTLPMFKGTLSDRGNAVLGAMANGAVTPATAADMLKALAAQARLVEVDELASRLAALEARAAAEAR